MKIGNIHYGAPQVVRFVQDGADVATTWAAASAGGQGEFVHDLTMISAGGHALNGAVNLIRGLKEASDNTGHAGKNLLIAMGDGIAAAGYAGCAAGLGWPTLAVAGVGTVLANFAEASAP